MTTHPLEHLSLPQRRDRQYDIIPHLPSNPYHPLQFLRRPKTPHLPTHHLNRTHHDRCRHFGMEQTRAFLDLPFRELFQVPVRLSRGLGGKSGGGVGVGEVVAEFADEVADERDRRLGLAVWIGFRFVDGKTVRIGDAKKERGTGPIGES